jgi:glycerophosphoryl diester phosphodiesterase
MIVYGHRGARGEAPENTIAGAQHAVARGVRNLEIDLQLSSDGELVVLHDTSIKRTVGSRGKVADFSARELAKMDARASGTPWPNKRGTGIPTLTALVEALPQIQHWQLELKSGRSAYNTRLVDTLVDWLQVRPAAAGVPANKRPGYVVTCSEPTLLTEVKRQLPEQATGYVSTIAYPNKIVDSCDCDFLVGHWSTMNPLTLRRLQRRGVHISAWTVNDASVIENLYRLGVDSVITDYPSMAVPLVAKLTR